MRQITATELSAWLARTAGGADPGAAPQLLDVREPWEVALGALPGAVAIPLGEVPARADALDPARPVVCVCHHGVRSLHAGLVLERRGFRDVVNLAGGVAAWARDVDPRFPTY